MNIDENMSELNTDLQKAIDSIRSALGHTISQKKLFQNNANVAKNQIQDDISFHLELLRNREVWLLEQVDIHAQIKEEAFENHLNKLCVLLAKLEAYQQLLETPELQENQEVIGHAEDVILRLKNQASHFDETTGICFSAGNFDLSDAVKKFGKIIEAEPSEEVEKLPKVHKRRRDTTREILFIQEHFKRVTASPQKDWLMTGAECQEARKDFGPVWKYFEELKSSDNKEWLYEKNQPMDLETVGNRFAAHFQQVKSTPANDWLQNIPTKGDENELSSEFSDRTKLDTSENIKAWLLRPLKDLSLSSKYDDLVDEGISLSRHCSIEPKLSKKSYEKAAWILDEKLSKRSGADSREISTTDQLDDDWLMGSYTSSMTSCPPSQTGSWLQRFRESSGTGTSDWLIVSETEPEPEYCEWLTKEAIERCKSCSAECPKENFGVFRNVLTSSKNDWLATATDW